MQAKEKLADYVADIKRLVIKGYPTADAQTREKINVRHFLKGLPDQQTAVSVGMREPATIDEARQILEMYNSLRDEVKNNRVRLSSLVRMTLSMSQKTGYGNSETRLRQISAKRLTHFLKRLIRLIKLVTQESRTNLRVHVRGSLPK